MKSDGGQKSGRISNSGRKEESSKKAYELMSDGSRVYHFNQRNSTKNVNNDNRIPVKLIDYPRLIFNKTKMPGMIVFL